MKYPYLPLRLVEPEHEALWSFSSVVADFGLEIFPYVDEMLDIMREDDAPALSAPQVGINLRFFMFGPIPVINPTILGKPGKLETKTERCINWPLKWADVTRPDMIYVKWQDENSKEIYYTLNGFTARLFQAMNDHLDGKCIFPNPKLHGTRKTQ